MTALAIDHLTIRFGNQPPVVDRVSLSLSAGRMLALVGESGSGKSLTAAAILRLLPPQARWEADAMRLHGEDILSLPPRGLQQLRGGRIGMVFQEPMSALNPLHTVARQIGETLQLHQGMSRRAAREQTLRLLEQVRLPQPEQFLERYPHQLSGGQRQRVMIAMALANRPQVLIADEPTTALDVTVQAGIMALLKQLQRELGLSVLLITHDLNVVRHYAEDLAVMYRGRIVEQGPTAAVLARPQAEHTRALLAAEPDGTAPDTDPSRPPCLQAQEIRVRFPTTGGLLRRRWTTVVDQVSLSVREGETLGIVGESGSGKSTLALALLRLIASDGRIELQGTRLDTLHRQRDLRPWRGRMQVVFQDPWSTLNPRMTVGQIITEGLDIHCSQMSRPQRQQALQQSLEEVGLPAESAHRYPHEFSGGQRQRISIARALILKPRLLVLDEPTSALDRSVQHQVVSLLRELQQRHGITYLFISHDLKLVRTLSHHLLVLHQGRVVESGPTEAVFATPRQAYTRELIEAAFLTPAC